MDFKERKYKCGIFVEGKLKRIKQAREEANHDINHYRQERERQFREFETRHLGTKGDIAQKIDRETDQRLEQMADDVENNRKQVYRILTEKNGVILVFFRSLMN